MRAVMLEIPMQFLERRRKIGADRKDEVWEGVLHLSPEPTNPHQQLVDDLGLWLGLHLRLKSRLIVMPGINIARPGLEDWRDDYRVPDRVILTPERFREIDRTTHCAGGPNVAIEVRSPNDESYEKLPFYFEVGVEEVWVIDRDTKGAELYARGESGFELKIPEGDGWLASGVTAVRMRSGAGRLILQLGAAEPTRLAIPISEERAGERED